MLSTSARDASAAHTAVVSPNAVGSTSYGRSFAQRLRGHWGELELPQFEAVIQALQDESVADSRLACAGNSYDGFLSAWAIGHSSMFRAAAVAAPASNIEPRMGQSEELFADLSHCTSVPVELVTYPQSSHAEAERGCPSNRVDYHGCFARWMERHANGAPAQAKR